MILQEYLKDKLFGSNSEIDELLIETISDEIERLFGLKVDLNNLYFVETGSHTMFFTSKRPSGEIKSNTLCNSPLNSKIFAMNNNSKISISLTCSKIKVNNPSGAARLELYDQLVRVIPASKKNEFIIATPKMTKKVYKDIKQQALINRKKHELSITMNKEANLTNLRKAPCLYLDSTENLESKVNYRNTSKISDQILEDLETTTINKQYIDLTDQCNYIQTNLINKSYLSEVQHYFLCLEKVVAKFFLKKLLQEDSLLYFIFSNKKHLKEIAEGIGYDLFFHVENNRLSTIDSESLLSMKIQELQDLIQQSSVFLNTKFNLFILYIYGLYPLGGRYQLRYMEEFNNKMLEHFTLINNKLLSYKQNIELKKMKERLSTFNMLDITSMIIVGDSENNYCNYRNLLEFPFTLDDKMTKILLQTMDNINMRTTRYLKQK